MVEYGKNVQKRNERMNKKKNGGYGCGSIIALLAICAFLIDVLPIAVALIIIAIIILGVRNNISKQKKLEESKEMESNYVTDSDLKDSIQRKNEVISAQNFEISDKNRRIKKLERQLEREKEENAFDVKERRVSGKTYISHIDDYFSEAGRLVIDKNKASVGMLQREFKIGFNRADRIMDELCEAGVVGEEIGTAPRKVLMNRDEFEELLSNGIETWEDDISNSESGNQQEISSTLNRIDMYNNQYDYMTGEDFEVYVAMILQQIGFVNVQLTKGSGDQGVDIIAEKDGVKYAFQCKRYDKPVGSKAVQEVFAGKFFYHCHAAVVVTNNYFTQSAKELSNENGVVLWDRDKLNSLIYSIQSSSERDEENLGEKEDEDRIYIPYKKPPISLLRKGKRKSITDEKLRDTAIKIQNIGRNLGVDLRITNINVGARFIRYGISAESVSINRIKNILDDIKYKISAKNIFVENPMLGEDTIGICIEDSDSYIVRLRDMLEVEEFKNNLYELPCPIGRDVLGNYVIEDIAKTNNLLISGVFGSGKTSCLNSVIMSTVYNLTPNEVKLIIIGTKGMDFLRYNGIPHLLIPVVTDLRKALGALNWCVKEMDERYRAFANANVKDINEYNNIYETDVEMPQILLLIDDLTDLMAQYKNETEEILARISRLSKAAGIHFIVSCRSQSTEIVTGMIKANMPNRILFKVFSESDSISVIDQGGAEELLGNGDMLFKKEDSQTIIRVQGTYVSDQEICSVVEFLRAKCGNANSAD